MSTLGCVAFLVILWYLFIRNAAAISDFESQPTSWVKIWVLIQKRTHYIIKNIILQCGFWVWYNVVSGILWHITSYSMHNVVSGSNVSFLRVKDLRHEGGWWKPGWKARPGWSAVRIWVENGGMSWDFFQFDLIFGPENDVFLCGKNKHTIGMLDVLCRNWGPN